jgi:type IV pilus assembly protein PilA
VHHIKRIQDREEEGFTLIELMVVLLIIAILLAIAIPTFLGARNTANARSAQENLRNALTAEQTNYTNNQAFSTDLSTVESALSWTSTLTEGGNTVMATVSNGTGGTNDQVILSAWGKDNNCYFIEASDNASSSFTGYAMEPQSGTGADANCATPPTFGAVATSGSAASGTAGSWYPNF